MLDDTAWLEDAGHETEIGTTVDQGAIREELVGVGPEAVGMLVLELPHLVSALSGVFFLHVDHTTDQDVNLVVRSHYKLFSSIKNEMHTLLSGDAAHESKKGHSIIKVSITEVLLLDELLGRQVIRGAIIELLNTSFNGNTIREGERK